MYKSIGQCKTQCGKSLTREHPSPRAGFVKGNEVLIKHIVSMAISSSFVPNITYIYLNYTNTIDMGSRYNVKLNLRRWEVMKGLSGVCEALLDDARCHLASASTTCVLTEETWKRRGEWAKVIGFQTGNSSRVKGKGNRTVLQSIFCKLDKALQCLPA